MKVVWPWAAIVAGVIGCSREEPIPYGDATGIRLSGGGSNGPELELAVAVTRGQDLTPHVSTVAGAFYEAVRACPAASELAQQGSALRLKLTLDHGKARAPSEIPAQPAAACMLRALDGKQLIMTDAAKLDMLAELRAAEKSG